MSSLTESRTRVNPVRAIKLRPNNRLDSWVAPLLTVVVLLSLWQIISWASPLREDLFPGPLAVAAKLP